MPPLIQRASLHHTLYDDGADMRVTRCRATGAHIAVADVTAYAAFAALRIQHHIGTLLTVMAHEGQLTARRNCRHQPWRRPLCHAELMIIMRYTLRAAQLMLLITPPFDYRHRLFACHYAMALPRRHEPRYAAPLPRYYDARRRCRLILRQPLFFAFAIFSRRHAARASLRRSYMRAICAEAACSPPLFRYHALRHCRH